MNLRLAATILCFLCLYLHANAYNDRDTRRQTGLKRRYDLTAARSYPEKRRSSVGTPARNYPEKRRSAPAAPPRLYPEKRRATTIRTPTRPYPEKRRAATATNARRLSNAAGYAKGQMRRSNAERKTLSAVRRLMPKGRKLPERKADKLFSLPRRVQSRRSNIDDEELDSIIDNILKYIFSEIQKLDIIPITDEDTIIAPDEKTLEESFNKLLQIIFDEIEKYTKGSGNNRRMNNAAPVMRRTFSQAPERRTEIDDEELDTAIDTILRLFFSEFQKLNITTCLGTGDDEVIVAPTEEELDSALDYVLELIFVELQNHNIIPKDENRRVFQNNHVSRRSEVNADDLDIAVENILKFIFSEIQKHNEAIQPTGEEIMPPDDAELEASFEVILKIILEQVNTKSSVDESRRSTRRTDFQDINEEELDSAVESILKLIFSEIQKHNVSSCFGLDPDDESITPPSDKELDTALDNILNLIFHELQKYNIIPTEGNNRRMKNEESEPNVFKKIYNLLFKKAKPAAATIVDSNKNDGQSRRKLPSSLNKEKLGSAMDNVVKLLFKEIGKLKS